MIEPQSGGPPILLVGVDGSETSLRAGAYAVSLARGQNARLVCLYVRTYGAATGIGIAAVPALLAVHEDIGAELRHTIRQQSERLGIRAEFVERVGNPFTELVRLADELPADALVVGASTKSGHRFVGSLAIHLVRASRWPVTVVP